MGTRKTSSRRRDPNTRTVVRLPERELSESVLFLAAPLIESLGSTPLPDDIRRMVEVTIDLWNAQVKACEYWGDPRPKSLADLRRKMCGKKAPSGQAEIFELLSSRWRKEFDVDPRLVGEWSLEVRGNGRIVLNCETDLPDGVEAEVQPALETRIAIGGQFLDEVSIRLTANSFLRFPARSHRGKVGSDGSVTVHTKMPTVVALFAEGLLRPVEDAPVELMVAGKKLSHMILAEVRCSENVGYHDVAVLVFKPAKAESPS